MPSYNNTCYTLAEALHKQAESICCSDFKYEIIVADDGSTDLNAVEQNSRINELPNCKYIIRKENAGRAAIRNFLARQAKGEYLLFLDSDRQLCSNDFILRYMKLDGAEVACGGLRIGGDDGQLCHNLRYRMEKKYEPNNTARQRQQREYQNFNTSNFITRRDILLKIPFDERFRRYGYEDVMWGKQLHDNNIRILHIDNPIMLDDFETNDAFVRKMETGMHTLHQFREELHDYSSVIKAEEKLNRLHLTALYKLIFNATKYVIRKNLGGKHPAVPLLNIYKLGIFINIK